MSMYTSMMYTMGFKYVQQTLLKGEFSYSISRRGGGGQFLRL